MFNSVIIRNRNYPGLNPVQFGYQDCEPSHSYGPVVYPHWLLHYVESGRGRFVSDGKEYSVEAGEFFVISPGDDSYYEADADDPWVYTWIGFTCAGELPAKLSAVVRCKAAGRIFEKMKKCEAMNAGRSAYLEGLLWQLFAAVLETKVKDAPVDISEYTEKAVSFMNTEYTRGVTIREVADALNLNRSYFSTLFKQQMGVSPKEYLLELRLEKAVEIMTEMGGTPTLAAMSTGFSDIYQFSKMFKSKYGISPREFIKRSKG